MKEKEIGKDKKHDINKKEWVAPKLFSLDKGKTEGGPSYSPPLEDDTYRAS